MKCHNCDKTYNGRENTPLGKGYHAEGQETGDEMFGKNRKKYVVIETKNGKRWQRKIPLRGGKSSSPRRGKGKTLKKLPSVERIRNPKGNFFSRPSEEEYDEPHETQFNAFGWLNQRGCKFLVPRLATYEFEYDGENTSSTKCFDSSLFAQSFNNPLFERTRLKLVQESKNPSPGFQSKLSSNINFLLRREGINDIRHFTNKEIKVLIAIAVLSPPLNPDMSDNI